MEIILSKQILKSKDLIILADKSTNLNDLSLSDNEISYIKKALKNDEKTVYINQYNRFIFIVFLVKDNDKSLFKEKARLAGYEALKFIKKNKIDEFQVINETFSGIISYAFIEGLMLSNYSFNKYFSKKEDDKEFLIKSVKIKDKEFSQELIDKLKNIVDAVFFTRDLVNEPFSGLNSVQFADRITELSKEAGLSVEVLNKKQIEALKMGGLLAVNRASKIPPTFSIIEWNPKDAKNKKPIVLVGKGIVFDTGGYNLKTGKYMNDMKSDMAGGASVIGTLYAIAKLKLPVHVIGLIPSTDNLIGKDGYVTGDVIRMYNGKTVEVLNTDAEGRLILADALSYAKKYDPELVIDIATLTGAAVVAIGTHASAIMSTAGKNIVKKITDSANDTFERVVEFPMWKEYGEELKSQIADLKNIGGSYAGHISAAKFLENFTDYPWVHIDIAGPAFLDSKSEYRGIGATGAPVRLLVNFIENYI